LTELSAADLQRRESVGPSCVFRRRDDRAISGTRSSPVGLNRICRRMDGHPSYSSEHKDYQSRHGIRSALFIKPGGNRSGKFLIGRMSSGLGAAPALLFHPGDLYFIYAELFRSFLEKESSFFAAASLIVALLSKIISYTSKTSSSSSVDAEPGRERRGAPRRSRF